MYSFRLGKFLGFEIRVDLSWFVICLLILWTLIVKISPAHAPGLSSAVYLGMGIVSTLLFVASRLLHELSHALIAQAKGVFVEGITLFAFEGVPRTRIEAKHPGDEFQIAAVGPLVSLTIAGLFACGLPPKSHTLGDFETTIASLFSRSPRMGDLGGKSRP